METGLDRYETIIGLFVVVTVGSILLWFSLAQSAGDEAKKIEGWLSTTSNGVTFQYPEKLTTRYVVPVDWPPQIQIVPGPLACSQAGEPMERAGRTISRVIDTNKFCITEVSQSVEGNVYSQYAYAFERGEKVYILTFSLKYFLCEDLEEGPKKDCMAERSVFDLDRVVSQMVSTLKSG